MNQRQRTNFSKTHIPPTKKTQRTLLTEDKFHQNPIFNPQTLDRENKKESERERDLPDRERHGREQRCKQTAMSVKRESRGASRDEGLGGCYRAREIDEREEGEMRAGDAYWASQIRIFRPFSSHILEENISYYLIIIFLQLFLLIFFPFIFPYSKHEKIFNFPSFFSFHVIFLGPNTP